MWEDVHAVDAAVGEEVQHSDVPGEGVQLEPMRRVSDLHWFNADLDRDPNPAFFIIADPESGSGSQIRIKGLMT